MMLGSPHDLDGLPSSLQDDAEDVGNQSGLMSSLQSAPSSRVDRLLQERIRRNRSHQQFDYDEATYDGPLLGDNEAGSSERLVVVANRLPVTCSKDAQGNWQLQVSAGGLVSALKGVSTYKTVWIGWPGIWVKQGRERDALTALLKKEGCIPVWVEPTLLDMYYNGFCNSVLWQLFHYVPLNIDSWLKMSEHKAMQMQWQAYQMANQKFADVVLEHYEPNDIMWVQDYHLMLLPSLLKAVVPKMKVGFFLHTPFPSSEMYRTLPVREEVLRAVLGADLIGFHTYDYARHFISSCTRILGLEGTPEGVENNGTITRVGTFPIGIDPERFTRALETDEVQSHVAKLLNKYAGRKIMLGVDRLDMVKGIPQKLLAFEKFLEEHAEWRDKVLLVQIAVPSRTDVPEYQKLRSIVHEIVGRINGTYGTLTSLPIYHLDTSLSFTELCALYAVTDVALVSSLRDGMNLVSYEYVACQSDNAGVLVLSEFAGAAQSLGAGAILVNPWNINDMAQAIEDALCMSEEERRERHRQNYMHVQTHTAQNWADTFISELNDTHIEADLRMRHAPPPLDIQDVVNGYKNSGKRLIVLGYNATLTTHIEAAPGRAERANAASKRQHDLLKNLAKPNPKVLACIQELCQDPCNIVAIFSGSETHKLEEIFGDLPVWLAAENGVFVRPPPDHLPPQRPGQRQWRQLFDGIHREWMESVQLVFDYFCERTPRSFVEARETSMVWNYKHADYEFGRIQARDLLQHLWTGPISNAPVEIIQGGKSVEVRPVGVTKGTATMRMVQLMTEVYGPDHTNFDFVLCIGHLLGRDENMFSYFEGARVDGSSAPAHGTRGERNTGHHQPTGPGSLQLNLHQQAQLQMQQQAMAAGAVPNTTGSRCAGSGVAQDPFRPMPFVPLQQNRTANSSAATNTQLQYQQQHLAAQQAQHPELFARLQAAAAARAASSNVPPGSDLVTGPIMPPGHTLHPPIPIPAAGAQYQLNLGPGIPHGLARVNQQGETAPAGLLAVQKSDAPSLQGAGQSMPQPGTQTALQEPYRTGPQPGKPPGSAAATSPSGMQRNGSGEVVNTTSPKSKSSCSPGRPPLKPGTPPHPPQAGSTSPGPRQPTDPASLVTGPIQAAGGSVSSPPISGQVPLPPVPVHMGRAGRSMSPVSPSGSNALGPGMTSYLDGVGQDMRLQSCFPPRFLYTCTVGRNRSKARYALTAASEVADLLDAIVQQGIYNREPPLMPSLHDLGLAHAMSRVDSYSSSTEPLSPDSMFTLISNWKNYRTSGVPSAPDLMALATQASASLASSSISIQREAGAPGSIGRRSKSGLIAPALTALAAANNTNPSTAANSIVASSGLERLGEGAMNPGTPSAGIPAQLPAAYLLSSPMSLGVGSLVPHSVPEEPIQEDLMGEDPSQLDGDGDDGGGAAMGNRMRQQTGFPHNTSFNQTGNSADLAASMYAGDMELGPSVSERGSPSPAHFRDGQQGSGGQGQGYQGIQGW